MFKVSLAPSGDIDLAINDRHMTVKREEAGLMASEIRAALRRPLPPRWDVMAHPTCKIVSNVAILSAVEGYKPGCVRMMFSNGDSWNIFGDDNWYILPHDPTRK